MVLHIVTYSDISEQVAQHVIIKVTKTLQKSSKSLVKCFLNSPS